MAYENLIDNKNAEKWTFEKAEKLFKQALKESNTSKYDFIGELAKKLGTYIDVFDYLIDKFPDLKHYKPAIMRNCEANCFSNGKNGDINTAMAIVNLKSNHGWTDRSENTQNINLESTEFTIINGSKD